MALECAFIRAVQSILEGIAIFDVPKIRSRTSGSGSTPSGQGFPMVTHTAARKPAAPAFSQSERGIAPVQRGRFGGGGGGEEPSGVREFQWWIGPTWATP